VATPAHSPQLLVVDDDEGLLILMAESLKADGCTVATARTAKTARAWLETHTPELMILDLNLPDGKGPALVAALQQTRSPLPFIVVTGQGDERVAVEIMKQGALDYVMKDTALLDLLPTIVRRALGAIAQEKALVTAQTEHKRLEREILAVGERERHAIGADLHDNLGQQLTALELMCTALKAEAAPHPKISKGLDSLGRMLREAITQTRALARGLVPVGSDPDALQFGLAEFASRIDSLGRVGCAFVCPEPVLVSDAFVAGHLYRIAQEGVNNALKHARARNITISLHHSHHTLVLAITDDGAGLPKGRAAQRGVGLGVMQHRARAIGAQLEINSKRDSGVTVECRLADPS
jgi:signal transduction histidine kinase